jgi:hypothetical protein
MMIDIERVLDWALDRLEHCKHERARVQAEYADALEEVKILGRQVSKLEGELLEYKYKLEDLDEEYGRRGKQLSLAHSKETHQNETIEELSWVLNGWWNAYCVCGGGHWPVTNKLMMRQVERLSENGWLMQNGEAALGRELVVEE